MRFDAWSARLCSAGVALSVLTLGQGPALVVAEKAPAEGAPAPARTDRIILKSGKVVEGQILEETATSVRMMVVVSGISAPTTYEKSEILELTRGAAPGATATPAQAPGTAAPATKGAGLSGGSSVGGGSTTEDPSITRLYLVELEGRFGSDISKTPLARIFEDVDQTFKDLIPGTGSQAGKQVVDPAKRDRNIVVLHLDAFSEPGFGSVFAAENIAPVVKEQIVAKGRRVVFWVKRAAGGAAFLPWVSPEIFFTDEGVLGGIADLDEFSSGDKMVDEKLISAFLGHAEGFAIKGGYGDHIPALRAMLREQNWLAVKFEGGKPVYLARKPEEKDGPGWRILSDDGAGENKDASALEGNDTFTLEAPMALSLGISDGTAKTEDDLADLLGLRKNFVVLKGKEARGQKIADDWKTRIEEVIDQVRPPREGQQPGRLWREFNDVPTGGDAAQAKRNIGRRINILKQIRALLAQYAEVLDPEGQSRAQLDIMIFNLQREAEGGPSSTGAGGGGGGGPSTPGPRRRPGG